ncbi:MAG: hypothetical protein HY329_10760 [Chloroflexi bacterium]|nr:hypothetical protein [Chloroflexota bacterium]
MNSIRGSGAGREQPSAAQGCLRSLAAGLLGLLITATLCGGFSVWYSSLEEPFTILVGNSMDPTLDTFYVVVAVPADDFARGDIVSWRGMMHRLVAIPGETAAVRRGELFVTKDGSTRKIDEPYIKYQYDWDLAPLTLGPDEFLFLGDNRTVPASRTPYVVKRGEARKLDRILFPPWARGKVESPFPRGQ